MKEHIRIVYPMTGAVALLLSIFRYANVFRAGEYENCVTWDDETLAENDEVILYLRPPDYVSSDIKRKVWLQQNFARLKTFSLNVSTGRD